MPGPADGALPSNGSMPRSTGSMVPCHPAPPRPRPQFPFDLNRPARVGAVKAFATYDYVILNSEFTDRWADCLGPFLSARCCRRLDELAAVDG